MPGHTARLGTSQALAAFAGEPVDAEVVAELPVDEELGSADPDCSAEPPEELELSVDFFVAFTGPLRESVR